MFNPVPYNNNNNNTYIIIIIIIINNNNIIIIIISSSSGIYLFINVCIYLFIFPVDVFIVQRLLLYSVAIFDGDLNI